MVQLVTFGASGGRLVTILGIWEAIWLDFNGCGGDLGPPVASKMSGKKNVDYFVCVCVCVCVCV